MLDEATLTRHLDTLGWRYEPHGARTYRVQQDTSEGDVAIYVRLTENWLIASIVPFLSTQGQNSFELCRWLLRMNRDMVQSKFALDEDGDVVLTVELPTESLDYGEIRSSMEDLVKQFVSHRNTLRSASMGGAEEPSS